MDLLAVEEGLAPLDGEAQARSLERLLEMADLREAPGEDHHVAGAAARGASRGGIAHLVGARARPSARKAARASRFRPRGGPPPSAKGAAKRRATTEGSSRRSGGALDRLVGGLAASSGAPGSASAKTRFTKRRMAGRERKFWVRWSTARPGRPARLLARAPEQRDLGPPETVDRLLRVAHHHERPGPPPVRRRAISTWSGSVSWNSSTIR